MLGRVRKNTFIYLLSCISLIVGLMSQTMRRQSRPPQLWETELAGEQKSVSVSKCTWEQVSCNYQPPVMTGDPRTLSSSHYMDSLLLQQSTQTQGLTSLLTCNCVQGTPPFNHLSSTPRDKGLGSIGQSSSDHSSRFFLEVVCKKFQHL